MAQAMALMTGLHGSSQAVLEGSMQISGSNRFSTTSNKRIAMARPGFVVRAQQVSTENTEKSRRTMLGLVATGLASATFAKDVLAAATSIKVGPPPAPSATSIKVGPPPAPSGGLPGTLNSDEARDLDLPLKDRFFLQPLTPVEAAARAKESAKEIINVKEFIDKKAWPYVQMDLRLRASYLRYDLNTVIASKSKDEKKSLQALTGKLYNVIDDLDYAAKTKSSAKAEKSYAETVSTLNDVLAKLG